MEKVIAIIEKRGNHDHITNENFKEVYTEYEEVTYSKQAQDAVEEYEASINADGFDMDDQDDMNDVEAVTNLVTGDYSFDCGDYTYFITIK